MKKYASNRKISVKIISFLLCAVLLFLSVPSIIFAEIKEGVENVGTNADNVADSSVSSDSEPLDIYSYTGVAYEAIELREESAKHFHLEDGSYVAAQYAYPVHIADENGKFVDIVNTLGDASGGMYANPSARIKFVKKIGGNEKLFELHDGNTKITFALSGAIKKTAGEVINGSDDKCKTELQKMMNLEGLTSRIVYKDILDGVDLEYVLESLNVKENIIVKQASPSYAYTFSVSLNGLTATLTESGNIEITNTDTKKVQYTIPAPFVFDANGATAPASAAEYKLFDEGNGKYMLTVTVSSEWMNSKERAFPVTVDPTVYTGASQIEDTYISSTYPTSSYGNSLNLSVSSTTVSLLKISQLPQIPTSAYITNATLTVRVRTGYSNTGVISVFEVLTDWDESLTWNQHTNADDPQGELADIITDYCYCGNETLSWNLTPLAKKWYAGNNKGVALNMRQGLSGTATMYSSESTVGYAPVFTVRYKDMKGTEGYWSYSSHQAGVAGTGSINLATGQLTLAIPTLSTTDSLMPYTPTLVYNSALANKDYVYPNAETSNTTPYMPYGFKLNICETIIEQSYVNQNAENERYYVYSDADGTEHAFFAANDEGTVFVDENGMQKRMYLYSDGHIEITDDTNWVRRFERLPFCDILEGEGWQLSQIFDESGNRIIFTYDTSTFAPTKVSIQPKGLSPIDFLEFYYYSNGKLGMVYNPTSMDVVAFKYSATYSGSITTQNAKYLREVIYAHGVTSVTAGSLESIVTLLSNSTSANVDARASYQYNSAGYITYAIDNFAGQKMYYLWSNKHVIALRHFAGTKLGQCVSYTYGTGYTDVKSTGNDEKLNTDDDIITRYAFDNEGRSRNVYSFANEGTVIYGATTGKYETQENIRNNLKEQTVIGGAYVNYLLNSDFEDTSSDGSVAYWYTEGAVNRKNEMIATDGDYAIGFAPTAGSSASICQFVKLAAGEYTFSMQYLSQRAENVSGTVTVTSVVGSGFVHTEQIPLNINSSNGIESVFSTTFTVPDFQNGGDKLQVTVTFTADDSVTAAPNIEIDRLMLENNIGAGRFNHVNYGGFDSSVMDVSDSFVHLNKYWTTELSSNPTIENTGSLFGSAVKILADAIREKYIVQRVYSLSEEKLALYDNDRASFFSNAGYEYIVSAFALAQNAIYSSNATFRIRVDVGYYQGQGVYKTVSHSFDFIPDCTGWQFTGGSFNTAYEKAADDTHDYSCVGYIDVYCDFSYQPNGVALFDNISVVNSDGKDVERYYYYSEGEQNGLLARKESLFYKEYYEYDELRNLTRVANNQGELTDYYYTDNNQIAHVLNYEFTWMSSRNYPYSAEDPDAVITKTPKTATSYEYTAYGKPTRILTRKIVFIEGELFWDANSKPIINNYFYDGTASSKTFGALVHEYDTLGIDIRYYYSKKNGRLLATVNCDENTGICYAYDNSGNLTGVRPATYVSATSYSPVTNAEKVTYTYNSNNLLSTISTNSTTYSFTYDSFGNATSVKAGDNTVVSYTYNSNNGKTNKVTYSNGFVVEYIYNDIELLAEIWYTDDTGTRTKAYEYEYTAYGQVHEFIDNINGKSTVYKYDTNNRLIGFIEYGNDDHAHSFSSSIGYEDSGALDYAYYYVNHLNGDTVDASQLSYFYAYDLSSSLLTGVTINTPNTSGTETFGYDDYERVIRRNYYLYRSNGSGDAFWNQNEYTYKNTTSGTTGLIATHTSTVNEGTPITYTYSYDLNGNITRITYSTGEVIRYVYDNLGQLIREDNGLRKSTYCYTYDDAGNIIAKTTHPLTAQGVTPTSTQNTDSYTYSSSAWGDLLTSFDGREITYDEIGNPLTYNNGVGYTFTWSGRQMTGLVKSNVTYSFTYNDEGIRTTKTKAGVTTTYYLSGSQIIGEETNGNITLYVYDSAGAPLGMQYHAASYAEDVWDVYWFEKNLLGDVVALYDEAGTKLITYTYDAHGRCWRMQHNGGYSTTAMNNPFRYRGYYYDSDLELYVLNSRYYDPYTGRFISPDDVSYLGANGDLNSYNLYAYCSNNPIALSYVCLGNSRNIGFTSCSVTSNACAVTSSQISPVNYGLNFDFIVNGVSTISTIHGWYQATSKLVNHVNYFYNNIEPFKNDMKVMGISTTKGVLAFNNFTWKLGKSDAFSVLLGVGFDVYDSIQNEASSGEMLLSASLTAVKGVGMIYLNKVIVYGATTAGSAICPGPGTAIGFVVGEVIYIIVDIAASNLLDELIDEIVN